MKQIVYRYNGHANCEETVIDDGIIPEKDELIERHGRRWKVVQVTTEHILSEPGPALPIVRIFLSEQLN